MNRSMAVCRGRAMIGLALAGGRRGWGDGRHYLIEILSGNE